MRNKHAILLVKLFVGLSSTFYWAYLSWTFSIEKPMPRKCSFETTS